MLGFGKIKNSMFRVLLLFIIVSLCWALDSVLTEAPITKDARQNLQAAYNICTWGVFSTKPAGGQKPIINHYREPLPPFVTAMFLLYYKQQADHLTDKHFTAGTYARLIKRVNIMWAFLLLLGSAVLSLAVIRNKMVAVPVVLLVYACFLRNPVYIDSLLSELPSAALLTWAAIVFIMCFRKQSPALFLVSGILLGFLALTKAIFLYVAVLVAMGMLVCFFRGGATWSLKLKAECFAFFMLGLCLTAGPWLLRNKLHFDAVEISSRGGVVLHYRALKNTMNSHEILAAFYLWGPGVYKRIVKNTWLDVDERDYAEGGRAARLNRSDTSSFAVRDRQAEAAGMSENTITYYRTTRAERIKIMLQLRAKGHPRPRQEADNFLKIKAMDMIVKRPLKHIVMTVPFAWRGIWCFYGGGVFVLLNAVCYGAFVVLCLYGAVTKNRELFLFCVLPMLMLLLYAFFTHNEARFSSPAIPFMIISFFIPLNFLNKHRLKVGRP